MSGLRPTAASARDSQSRISARQWLSDRNTRNLLKTLDRVSLCPTMKPGLSVCNVSQKPARALRPNDVIFTVCARTPSKEPTS
jgi:hypothetical protein